MAYPAKSKRDLHHQNRLLGWMLLLSGLVWFCSIVLIRQLWLAASPPDGWLYWLISLIWLPVTVRYLRIYHINLKFVAVTLLCLLSSCLYLFTFWMLQPTIRYYLSG
jgi:hypothetical protein